MFKTFYRLNENPFPAEFPHHGPYLSPSQKEALAHLNYGVDKAGGFILLIGEKGCGKTSLLNYFIAHLPANTDTAFISNPALTEWRLLRSLCDAFAIDYEPTASLKELIEGLNYFLQAHERHDRRTVVIVDDAQYLSEKVLEQLRLLTNLQAGTTKLLQIILVGRPELKQHLNQASMRKISQRIAVRYQLVPLNLAETAQYIEWQLKSCGRQESLFNPRAIKQIVKFSGGNISKINLICERALMIGYGQSSMHIDVKIAQLAIQDVLEIKSKLSRYTNACLAIATALVLMYLSGNTDFMVNRGPIPITAQIQDKLICQTSLCSNIANIDTENKTTALSGSVELNTASVIDKKTDKTADISAYKRYVVQMYAGNVQPVNLKQYFCGNHRAVIHHRQGTFFITSADLNLDDARKLKQALESRCQLDSWVKPLPESWLTQSNAHS